MSGKANDRCADNAEARETPAGMKGMLVGSASPLAIAGAALFWLWVDNAVFTATLCNTSSGQSGYAASFIAATAVTVVALAAMVARPAFSTPFDRRGVAASVTAGLVGTIGGLIACSSSWWVTAGAGHLANTLDAAGFCLIGLAFSILNMAWGWVCVVQGHGRALIHITGAWALSLPFNLIFSLLPAGVTQVIVSLLPLASVTVLLALGHLQDRPALRIERRQFTVEHVLRAKATFLGFDARLLALILVFCTVFGAMYANTIWMTGVSDIAPRAGIQVVGTRGLTALVFFVLSLTVLRDKVKMLFRLCLTFVLVGLVAMVAAISLPELGWLSNDIVAVGYCGFDVLVWVMVAFHGYVSDNDPGRNVAIAMGAEQTGILVGVTLGSLLLANAASVSARLAVVMALSLLAMIVLIGYTEYGSRLWALLVKTSLSSDQAFGTRDRLDGFARAHGLTRREAEILALFADGRSMPYIAEKTYVSENTVKTHVRHIYAKCGVHNKQELIDLVEDAGRE